MATLTAWERFVVGVPEAQREYRTIEIYHPDLSQPYRFVSNSLPVDLTLESDAPRNPGELVTFAAASLRIIEPSEREDSEQNLQVNFGNVDGAVHSIIDQVSNYFDSVDVVYRKYYSGDLSEPAITPLYLYASGIVFDGPVAVSFTAEDVDLSKKRSGSLYTLEQFPGLRE